MVWFAGDLDLEVGGEEIINFTVGITSKDDVSMKKEKMREGSHR